MVLTYVGYCCFSYTVGVSLENSLEEKHKVDFVEIHQLTWSFQNLCVYLASKISQLSTCSIWKHSMVI